MEKIKRIIHKPKVAAAIAIIINMSLWVMLVIEVSK